MSEFIAVASPKGGVGKTTIATNMAVLLARAGDDVLLADINLSSPDVSLHLSIKNPPQTFTDVLKGHIPIEGAIYRHELGLKVLPAKQNSHSHMLFPQLHEHIPFLAQHAEKVIIDFPPMADSRVLNLLATFDKILLISSNDMASQKRAVEIERNLLLHNPGKIIHLLNHTSPSENKLPVSVHPEIFEIPFDSQMREYAFSGLPLAAKNKHSPAVLSISEVLEKIIGRKIKTGPRIKNLLS